MKSFKYLAATMAFVCIGLPLYGQTTSTTKTTTTTSSSSSNVGGGTNAARTDIYHIHTVHASPGKAAELGESFKNPGPGPAPDHTVVFRHQYGDSWDYTVVAHYGTKFTIEAARQQMPESQRALSDSHTDTICNGPSWADLSRVLGLDDSKKSSGAVYVVSYYRAVGGQRDALEKNLAQPPDPANDKATGQALFQHLEGANWHYMGVVRYNTWQDLATSSAGTVATTAKADSPWSQMRQSTAWHTDTLCDWMQ